MSANVVVCASGEGSGFEALVLASREGRLAADIVGLIVNRQGTGAERRAAALGVPCVRLSPRAFENREKWDSALVEQLTQWQADWVVLAGFLALIGPQVLRRFPKRVVNSHPALLPKHGGPGMYGEHVHQAVLHAGDLQTGVTIHFIDGEYDRGQTIAQKTLPVNHEDTVISLAARVKALEHVFYPQVLNDLVTGRITKG